MKKYFLFDLDGTLTDPKLGICTCVQYALKDQGIEVDNLDVLEPFIGPPLKDSFMNFYNLSDEDAEKAVAKYRERFSDVGLFENEVYEGIPQMLRGLKAKGFKLAVASSKPQVFVERILEHFSLKQYFDAVVGSELDGTRVNKDEVVREALRQLFGDKPVEPDKVYMIGDRRFDVEGAKAFRIESVGVTYGYGGLEELMEAKADYIVQSVPELYEFLLREVEVPKPKGFFDTMWPFLYPFLLFVVVKSAAGNALLLFMENVAANPGAKRLPFFFFMDEVTGEVLGLTGNATSIMNALTYIVAVAFIWKTAKLLIQRAKGEMWLAHLRGDEPITYGLCVVGMISTVLGLNVLLEILGVTQRAEAYEALVADAYGASRWVGIICFGFVIPVVEEILFRGVMYNSLKRRTKLPIAMIISAFAFGAYRLDYVQGVYAFVLGCVLVYCYEYFGSFAFPVALHIIAGTFGYIISYTSLVTGPLYSLPVGIACAVIAVICFKVMENKKRHLKGSSEE